MNESLTIAKHPVLDLSQDYGWLRARGLEHIQQLGSRLWTDYNIHDPGITLLELLCYALTDLGYRTGHAVADLLAAPPGQTTDFKRQAIHTAREALTMNPLTVRDFRKLIIDIDGIKNGWLDVKQEACEGIEIYANCATAALQYFPATESPVVLRGLYDVLLEFDDVDRMGNLNSGKVFYPFAFRVGEPDASTALIELRLPSWGELEASSGVYQGFRKPTSAIVAASTPDQAISVEFISGNKGDDRDVQPADQAAALRGVMYVTLQVKFHADAADPASITTLHLQDVPMRVWFQSDAARRSLPLSDLKKALEDGSVAGLIGKYHALVLEADRMVESVRLELQQRRNLGEDWCGIRGVATRDIAICADIEMDPAADIEGVTAEAFYRIDQYFSPEVPFHSLQELLERDVPVEQIFEGPKLRNGFLDDAEVDASTLRTAIYASDLVNLLMDIPGVLSIRNLVMSSFDREGKQSGPGERWDLAVPPQHQPRFYPQASKFLIFKNGLPVLPDISEVGEVLGVIKGRNAQPKFPDGENDLAVPTGTYLQLQDYHPIQYQLPVTYGVAFEGLPSDASVARVAQARQLKGYLLFFEQMLVDYLAQLAHLSELFAVDASVAQTYFSSFIDDSMIRGVETELYKPGFDGAGLQLLSESAATHLDRRNRFLDHLLSRFGESFADYAVMLFRTSTDKSAAQKELVERKIEFLRGIPAMTHDRAKAFNYTSQGSICDPTSTNAAGLALRIRQQLCLEAPDDKIFVVEHILLRPRRPDLDPFLPICISPDCESGGEEDPYSFRISVILSGEGGQANSEIAWRRFAERAIRTEVPAHLLAKICWVSREQLALFETAWCAWLAELAKTKLDEATLALRLKVLLEIFISLKSVYPPASLHDCIDGNDENRVFLDQTVITSSPHEE